MLTVNHLVHRYPGAETAALDGVSLTIGRGECWGLLGPNGAGKTTLMSLLCGLQEVQQGDICFDGTPMQALERDRRRKIGLVPQDFAFYPQLSVWDNMLFFAALYAVRDRNHLRQLLAEAGLSEYRTRRAGHLSGGLKRRLNFAIGLINRPELVFLDEITVGIDPQSRQFILQSVAALRARGVTVVYTSHYLPEIEQLCDHLALLSRGRLVYCGALAALLRQASAQVDFSTEPPLDATALAQLGAQAHADGGRVQADAAAAAALYARLQADGRRITAFRQGPASLEAFYLDFLRQHGA